MWIFLEGNPGHLSCCPSPGHPECHGPSLPARSLPCPLAAQPAVRLRALAIPQGHPGGEALYRCEAPGSTMSLSLHLCRTSCWGGLWHSGPTGDPWAGHRGPTALPGSLPRESEPRPGQKAGPFKLQGHTGWQDPRQCSLLGPLPLPSPALCLGAACAGSRKLGLKPSLLQRSHPRSEPQPAGPLCPCVGVRRGKATTTGNGCTPREAGQGRGWAHVRGPGSHAPRHTR